jgi:hypothetical protein
MVTLLRGKKFEITSQLSPEGKNIIAQWIGSYGVIWNCKVSEAKKELSRA